MSVSDTGYHRELAAPSGRPRFIVHEPAEVTPFEPVRPAADSNDAGISLLGYWQTLVKRRLVIAITVVVALALGLAITLLIPAAYTATATVQIEREAPHVLNSDQQDVEPEDVVAGDEFYQTQYGLLRSKSLAQRVIGALNLTANPAFLKTKAANSASDAAQAAGPDQTRVQRRAYGIFSKNLKVDPVRGSHLVKISFTNASAALAAQIANATADNFITSNLERRYEATSYARDFLATHLTEVKQKLEDSEKVLSDYAVAQGIIDLPGAGVDAKGDDISQSPTASTLEALNASLSQATADRIKAEQEWRSAQSSNGADLPQVLENSTIQALTQSRAALEATYQQKLALYKPSYPAMLQLRAQIDEIDRQIAAQTTSIKASLRAQYQVAASQERSLQGKVGELKSSVLDLGRRSIQYNILQREVDTNRALYDGLLSRYKEVAVAGGVGINNISVVDRADVPAIPSQPQPLLNMSLAGVGGLLLGALVALALEALDQSIRTPEDV